MFPQNRILLFQKYLRETESFIYMHKKKEEWKDNMLVLAGDLGSAFLIANY